MKRLAEQTRALLERDADWGEVRRGLWTLLNGIDTAYSAYQHLTSYVSGGVLGFLRSLLPDWRAAAFYAIRQWADRGSEELYLRNKAELGGALAQAEALAADLYAGSNQVQQTLVDAKRLWFERCR